MHFSPTCWYRSLFLKQPRGAHLQDVQAPKRPSLCENAQLWVPFIFALIRYSEGDRSVRRLPLTSYERLAYSVTVLDCDTLPPQTQTLTITHHWKTFSTRTPDPGPSVAAASCSPGVTSSRSSLGSPACPVRAATPPAVEPDPGVATIIIRKSLGLCVYICRLRNPTQTVSTSSFYNNTTK